MKYIIPTVALAISVTVIPVMDSTANLIGSSPVSSEQSVRSFTRIRVTSDSAIAARVAAAKKDIAIIRAGIKAVKA